MGHCGKCLLGVVLVICVVKSSCLVVYGTENSGERCEFPDGTVGKCEEVSGCMQDGGVIVRNYTVKLCSDFQKNRNVCCRKPFQIASEVCRAWKHYWRDNGGKCVFKNPLIVGGEVAGVGELPHIAILGKSTKKGPQWVCGGTLISPHFVLTAAHCVEEIAPFEVKFGEHNIFEDDQSVIPRVVGPLPLGLYRENELHADRRNTAPVEQTYKISEFILHPDYIETYHDIALLKLERPVVMTKRVLPACLPFDPKEDFLNKEVTVAGWGRVTPGTLKLSPTLQKVKIPIVDRLNCWEAILARKRGQLIPNGILKEQICAGLKDKDSCQGDSGGPMVLQMSKSDCEHILAGIVSFGDGCGRLGVYTRVSSYVDWITGYIAPGLLPFDREA